VFDVVGADRQGKMQGPDYTDYFLKATIEENVDNYEEGKEEWKALRHSNLMA